MAEVFHTTVEFDETRLRNSIQRLFDTHEILTASLFLDEGEPYLKFFTYQSPKIKIHKMSKEVDVQMFTEEVLSSQRLYKFNLYNQPLIVFDVYFWEDQWILCYNIHHIISDGVSNKLIFEDLEEFYFSKNEKRLNQIQFKHAIKQYQIYRDSTRFYKDKVYWKNKLEDSKPIELFPERIFENKENSKGESYIHLCDKFSSERLTEFSKEHNVTLYNLILSALNITLFRMTNSSDIVIGCPVTGRYTSELEKVIGCLVNIVLLRNNISLEENIIDFIKRVNANTVESLDHQRFPFEEMLKNFEKQGNLYKNPVTNIYLNYLNTDSSLLHNEINDERDRNRFVKFGINIYLNISDKVQFNN